MLAAPQTPPTTPPAIAPLLVSELELELFYIDVGVDLSSIVVIGKVDSPSLQLITPIPAPVRIRIRGIPDRAVFATEVAAVDLQIPCLFGPVWRRLERFRAAGNVVGMWAVRTTGTADSVWLDGRASPPRCRGRGR